MSITLQIYVIGKFCRKNFDGREKEREGERERKRDRMTGRESERERERERERAKVRETEFILGSKTRCYK